MASSRSKAYAKRRRQAQKRRQQNEQLQIETLEPKVLLAGNTSTEVAQIVSVVPQPITRSGSSLTQARNQIDVYFNDVDLVDSSASAENPALYQLIYTADTITNTDDTVINPIAVNYNPSANKAVLTFANNLTALGGDSPFRLRVNTQDALPTQPLEVTEATIYVAPGVVDPATDAGSSFATAASITTAATAGDRLTGAVTIEGTIETQEYALAFPGDDLEPGMRDLPTQPHYLVDTQDLNGIAGVPYNFRSDYGFDTRGNALRNAITPNQIARVREVFDIYSSLFGVTFYETDTEGFTIATGDVRALGGTAEISVAGFAGPDGESPTAILNLTEAWDDSVGGSYYKAAMREISRLMGMGVTPEAAGSSVTGSIGESIISQASNVVDGDGRDTLLDNVQFGIVTERIFPGEASTIIGQHLYRPDSIDIDLYRFQLSDGGRFSAETIAERLSDSSLLDTVLTLYKRVGTGYELISRNDDYFSEDSLIDLELDSGTYIIGVSASGNTNFDPTIENTGLNGTSEGDYKLRLDFQAKSTQTLLARSGASLDGDGDGVAGGVFNFWFEANDPARTVYVDKSASGGGDGSLNAPYSRIDVALNNATNGRDIVRIVGNGGADGDINTLGDNLAYELGFDDFQQLDDGGALVVPRDVTVMVDEGAIFKMRRSYVQVGSTTTSIDNSGAAFQVLGTPDAEVIFTSRRDETIGVDTQLLTTTPGPGDWGGVIFQNDLDRTDNRLNPDASHRDFEARGIFMNHVSNADLRYGGGSVTIDSVQRTVNPVHLIDARPTVSYNDISFSADAAISANPDSFEESRFHGADSLGVDYQAIPFTSDYDRIGPDVQGNFLQNNTTNALALRIDTLAGNPIERMTVSGRFDDTDIVHTIKEDLIIQSTPGGPRQIADGTLTARTDASLVVDPGIVVKLSGSRIEATVGSQLIAEGNDADGERVIFTSIDDDRFGGVTEVAQTTDKPAAPGDWGGIYIGHSGRLSIDNAVIAYAGGVTRIPGSSAAFNAIELHQAKAARIANSVIENNANGLGGIGEARRAGHGQHGSGAIFVRGSQPVILDNEITGTEGLRSAAINIDVNSLNSKELPDYGRSRGQLDRSELFDDNEGPLIRENVLDNNSVNGMVIRDGVLATESVWDDTDVVHVVYGQIVIPNAFSNGGLRIESTSTQSLIVKLDGDSAGFTTTGIPLDIADRVGGVLNVIGQAGKPVVFTSLADDTVGAGLDLNGRTQTNTDEGHFRRPSRTNEAGSFQIDINFGPEIRKHPDIMAGVERAARLWEDLLEDPVTITIDFELDSHGLPGNVEQRPVGEFVIPLEYTVPGGPFYLTDVERVEVDFDEIVGALKGDARSHESFVNDLPGFETIDVTFPSTPEDPFSIAQNIEITNANYRALFGNDADGVITPQPSAYDANEGRDGSILINEGALGFLGGTTEPVFYDFDRSDGIQTTKYDFTGIMSQAIGGVLGFESSIDDVQLALTDNTEPREIALTPMDLFRVEPGDGGEDFEEAARALDPAQQAHVFYDGGIFNPIGLPTEFQYRDGDIPLFVEGSSYAPPGSVNGIYLGLEQGIVSDFEYYISDQDRAVFDSIGYDVIGGPVAGDWRGIQLEMLTHDRNVAVINEFEDINDRDGANQVPSQAQVLGSIAKSQEDADENRRIGFHVIGNINNPSDVDVYSFDAQPGTELWIDIDRTSQALDTVVELVDSNGLMLARSDNSFAETAGLEQRSESPQAPTFNLSKSPFLSKDLYGTNPLDAGLRVLIPGSSQDQSTFFVRVRSSSDNLNVLSGGLTEGSYELQIRTQELDEVGGTSVQYADVRYAVDGIRVTGLPRHSILTGEFAEDGAANDTFEFGTTSDDFRRYGYYKIRTDLIRPGQEEDQYREISFLNGFPTPQYVGNVLGTDGAIAISGKLETPLENPDLAPFSLAGFPVDVDYYTFSVDFGAVQSTGLLPLPTTASVMFDVDYADGLGRPDTSIYVFRTGLTAQGDVFNSGEQLGLSDLVAYSTDGGDRDDLPAPLSTGTDVDDLSRGSVGGLDPLLGPIELTEGAYVLVVAPHSLAVSAADGQFSSKLPLNPGLRVEPLRSVGRIAEDTFDGPAPSEPEIPILVDPVAGAVPLSLADVPLFVSTPGIGLGSEIFTVDTFQGGKETKVGTVTRVVDPDGGGGGDEGPAILEIGDIALAERNFPRVGPDITNVEELLFGFTKADNDANSGRYVTIRPTDATTAPLIVPVDDNGGGGGGDDQDGNGDDQIVTYRIVEGSGLGEDEEREIETVDEGVQFEALALLQLGTRQYEGYAIGSRSDPDRPNILYSYDHRTGLATPNAEGDKREEEDLIPVVADPADPIEDEVFGFSDIVERGVLFTDGDRPFGAFGPDTAIPNANTSLIVSAATDENGQPLIVDGETLSVSNDGEVTVYEFDIADDYLVSADPVNGVHILDGGQFEVGALTYEFDTGASVSIDDFAAVQDGDTLAVGDLRSGVAPLFIEMDSDGVVTPGRLSLDLAGVADEADMATQIAELINSQVYFSAAATAVGSRISLQYDSGAIRASAGFSIEGSAGVEDETIVAIPIEEFATSEQIAATISEIVGATVSGSRIGFGDAVADLDTASNGVIQSIGSPGVELGNETIAFSVDFDRQQIADAIVDAVGREATAYDGVVTIRTGGRFTFQDAGDFAIEGQSPGGQITGMTFVGSQLFAVSDRGGLFVIDSYANGATANYLEQSSQLLGTRFSGLTVGPAEVAGGAYADTLFATDSAGNLHAFTTDGIPAPVFADGASTISTGVAGANGLAFSSSQSNLWETTSERGGDAGHNGGNSLHFGDAQRIVDYPGGTQGTVISNEVDLSNYTPTDLPALYFNYFMTAEESELLADPVLKRDAFRVFISDDSADAVAKGTWHLLATSDEAFRNFDNDPLDGIDIDVQTLYNNSYQDTLSLVRELDGVNFTHIDPDVVIPANGVRDAFPPIDDDDNGNFPPFPPGPARIQQPEDWFQFSELDERQGVWRQARIDLSPFAGQDSLRLRFDFSTAASFDLGNFGGVELKAVAGDELSDGDTLTVDGVTFEVELGASLTVPSGKNLRDGEQLLFLDNDGAQHRFQFTTDGLVDEGVTPVLFTPSDPSEVVMTNLVTAVNGLGTVLTAELVGSIINLTGVDNVLIDDGSLITANGVGLDAGVAPGNVPLVVTSSMSSDEVAQVLAAAFVAELGEGIDANYVATANVIKMYGDDVTDQGPFGLATELRGDEWGTFVTDDNTPAYRGQDNIYRYYERDDDTEEENRNLLPFLFPPDPENDDELPADFVTQYEGVFVDDIIIGFRSRGEEVTDQRTPHLFLPGYDEPDFNADPRIPNVFAYYPQDATVSSLDGVSGEYRVEIRTTSQVPDLELNQLERTVANVTLVAPSGIEVFDGKQFKLNDGNQTVTFEYNDVADPEGLSSPTHVAVDYAVGDSSALIAVKIRDAVNFARTLAQGDPRKLNLAATSADGGTDVGVVSTESNRINLVGDAKVIEVDTPNGIDFINSSFEGSGNFVRSQGQVIITQSQVSNSAGHGIIVEDAGRNLPTYAFSDPAGVELHGNFSEGRYSPNPGPVQTLREINREQLTTGVVISNNVIAFNGEGGIKYTGDPNGYTFVAPVASDPEVAEVWDGLKFSVTDLNGKTRTFEFHDLRTSGGVNGPRRPGIPTDPANGDWEHGNIPIMFSRSDFVTTPSECPFLPLFDCEDRFQFAEVDMGDRLQEAFERSDLDVTVFRGLGTEIFIEGVQEMLFRPTDVPSFAHLFSFARPVTTGPVPFGRIINNTIVGLGGEFTDTRVDIVTPLDTGNAEGEVRRVVNDHRDIGIEIGDNADPTLLNNVVVNFETGLSVDLTAVDVVREGMVFQGNNQATFNTNPGDFSLSLDNDDPLFVDLLNGNFYPAAGSEIIDSSVDSLQERPSLETVKTAIGIAPSPILVPNRDGLGQLREDDPAVEPQNGQGRNAFKDRGAIDRVDFVGPIALLRGPRDNDALGVDENPAATKVSLSPLVELELFEIEFQDSSRLGGAADGTGVDLTTVSGVTVLQDGQALAEGTDYTLDFDPTIGVLRIIPTAGNWPAGRIYKIELDGVSDLAGNSVRDNQIGGGVNFEITTLLGTDFGDAPAEYPAASHDIVDGFFLGSTVTADAGSQPEPSASADGGDDGVFLPDEFLRNEANTITVQASAAGILDAWFDFNNNRIFDDSERVFSGVSLAAGANELSVSLPRATAGGELFARFRFSEDGVASPSGLAPTGEVEDYVISVDGGAIWQNLNNPFDVDNDGFIAPRDFLLISQEIKKSLASDPVTKQLDDPFVAPNTPSSIGFVDVTGDGFVSPSDLLAVVTEINNAADANGEPPEADAAVVAAMSTSITVDPIGQILENPVVELPVAERPVATVLDEVFTVEDDSELVLEVAATHDASSADDVFADADWLADDSSL